MTDAERHMYGLLAARLRRLAAAAEALAADYVTADMAAAGGVTVARVSLLHDLRGLAATAGLLSDADAGRACGWPRCSLPIPGP